MKEVTDKRCKQEDLDAWAEQAPQRCIVISDTSIRYPKFSSSLEALAWVQLFFKGKEDLLLVLTQHAVDVQATEYPKLSDFEKLENDRKVVENEMKAKKEE